MSTAPLRMSALAVVSLGGAAGACLRWALETTYAGDAGSFPWTTFGINVAGSAVLALLLAASAVRRHPLLAPALGTGVLGGFTTLSAYSEEARLLLAEGRVGLASAYLTGTLAACLAGVALADVLTRGRRRGAVGGQDGAR